MSPLDYQLLRTSHPQYAGPYLHRIATEKKASTDAISQELLHTVASQSLPPRVYELWLCACPDETAIVLGLQQSTSVLVRRAAIKAFRRWFRTSKCVDIWQAVGGTEGIVTMLAEFSVNHVREFSKVLGQCGTSKALRKERQKIVTELMYSLASGFFTTPAKVQNPDERPLWKSYAELVYACTPEARDAWINEESLPELDMVKVMQTDTDYYQDQCLAKAAAGDKNLERYSALLFSLPARISAEDPTVTKSMEFAALLLETLAEHDVQLVKGGGEHKLGTAFVTIIRRLARRNVSEDFVLETITLISKCAKQHVVEEASGCSHDYGQYLNDIARLWTRNPDAFEAPLSALLNISDRINYSQLFAAISTVPLRHRYRLLRWIVLIQHEVDIDDTEQLPRFRYPIPWGLPTALPKAEARALVERVVLVKGENDSGFKGTMSDLGTPDLVGVNVVLDLLRCHLMDGDNARLNDGTLKTAQYQRRAEKERDAQARIKLVIAAGYMAVASGSLDLFRDVLVWARRFNRDPLIYQFYAADGCLRKAETLSLLSGVPEWPIRPKDRRDTIRDNVRKGNRIILLLFETAAMCQREPSFYASHWSIVQHMFADVVQVRIQRTRRLKSRLRLVDHEVDNLMVLMWRPTLDAILHAEGFCLEDRDQALQFNEMDGLLDVWGDVVANDPDSSVVDFFNELAIRRNELWQRHRSRVHPSVTTLEAPWPRGLPVKALLSVQIQGETSGKGIPYVMKRAESVVFMAQADALRAVPESKDDKAAIGCFVEDYSFALNIYVSGCDKKERQRRINAAWEHATTNLSEPRLSAREALMYWKDIFAEAEVSPPASKLELRPSPKLPEVDVQDDNPEWNPDPGPHPTIKDRELDPTCLDCFTTDVDGRTIHDAFIMPQPSISLHIVPGFWSLHRFSSGVPFYAKDGFIAAGLLLIDAKSQADAKIFSEAFPEDGARFPAVFLDSDFVENQLSFDAFPLELLNSTPPALLEQLTTALLAKLCTSESPPPTLVKWAFMTLKLLAWSDDPGLAIPHIVNVIINLPDHSSWHRVMLHPGVLKRLSMQQSKTLVATLADAINEKSRQRKLASAAAASAPKDSDNDAKTKPTNFVKVTTVKLLAQLMSHADFIGESFTVAILANLFTEATHVDIRAAVVESLLAIATSTNTASIRENVMSMLETDVVPFAAELSERSPMTEESWAEKEEKCEPPDIDTGNPSRDALLAFVEQSTWQKDPVKTRELIRRLLLPLIQKTAANGRRWLKIMLRANNASELYDHVPGAFGVNKLLKGFLEKRPAHMPAAMYDDLHTLLVFFAKAPKQYHDLEDCFDSMDPPLVGHDQYSRMAPHVSPNNYEDPNIAEILKTAVFATAEDAAANKLITPAQLQARERTMIDVRLVKFDRDAESWDSLTSRYNPPLRHREAMQMAWYTYCRPLVEYMVKRIEDTRTPAWLQDPERQPARLPDAFPLRLWLLTYPSRPWRADDEQELRRDTFVKELCDLVERLARSGRPYHKHFALVVAAAKKCYEKDWAFIAWRLGALEEEQKARDSTLVELMRIELADSLLQGAKLPVTVKVMEGVKDMLAQWRSCLDEDVRDRGIVTTALLKKNSKNKDALPME